MGRKFRWNKHNSIENGCKTMSTETECNIFISCTFDGFFFYIYIYIDCTFDVNVDKLIWPWLVCVSGIGSAPYETTMDPSMSSFFEIMIVLPTLKKIFFFLSLSQLFPFSWTGGLAVFIEAIGVDTFIATTVISCRSIHHLFRFPLI